jgi:hypothetical protein
LLERDIRWFRHGYQAKIHEFKIQWHSDPTSKSLLGILHDLCESSSMSWRTWINPRIDTCRSLSVRGFPKRMRRPCHIVTFPGSARDQCDGGRQLNSTDRFRFMHTCL